MSKREVEEAITELVEQQLYEIDDPSFFASYPKLQIAVELLRRKLPELRRLAAEHKDLDTQSGNLVRRHSAFADEQRAKYGVQTWDELPDSVKAEGGKTAQESKKIIAAQKDVYSQVDRIFDELDSVFAIQEVQDLSRTFSDMRRGYFWNSAGHYGLDVDEIERAVEDIDLQLSAQSLRDDLLSAAEVPLSDLDVGDVFFTGKRVARIVKSYGRGSFDVDFIDVDPPKRSQWRGGSELVYWLGPSLVRRVEELTREAQRRRK